MRLKAKVEALIYAAEDPITLEQMAALLRDAVLAELTAEQQNAEAEYPADISCESTFLPGLDSATEEWMEPGPGPLMPQDLLVTEEAAGEAEPSAEVESIGEDDEPFFALEATPLDAEAALVQVAGADVDPSSEAAPAETAGVIAPEAAARKRQPKKSEQEIAEDKSVRARLREVLAELIADYASEERGMEIRQIAGGFRMATKPQHHDLVRAFAKSLKPPTRLSLAALETLAVIAYKQPVTAPEIAEIRGVDSASALGTLLDRKLITTAGRKQVIGRPMQYKTSKDFLLRFGLNDLNELPSMEEFSQLALDVALDFAPAESTQPPLAEATEAAANPLPEGDAESGGPQIEAEDGRREAGDSGRE